MSVYGISLTFCQYKMALQLTDQLCENIRSGNC